MDYIYNFLNDTWLMDGDALRRLSASILPALTHGDLASVESRLKASHVSCYATTPYLADRWELSDPSLPEGSVAVLELEGPLYAWETFRLERLLEQVEGNGRIVGVVLWVNGPGGMTTHVDVVAKMIRELEKPVAVFVADLMASAHFWIGSGAGRRFRASELCRVGSVGIVGTYISMAKAYEMAGIDYREIYPDTSDLKNRTARDIEENNDESRIKKELETLHLEFCHQVSEALGIEYDPDAELFRGEMFDGRRALELGLADEVGTLKDAVAWVTAQSVIRQI